MCCILADTVSLTSVRTSMNVAAVYEAAVTILAKNTVLT